MSYSRERWEKKSFQVITEMDGSVRSGYFPTGEGLVAGNIAVDFAHGNFPIQPNEDRDYWLRLSAGDSHKIAAVEWDSYPSVANSRNYMVTGAEYLGGVLYEYTSQNNLKVGDYVRTTNCPGYNGTAYVVYADANKFRTENELGATAKLTGLYGRVDVMDNSTGSSLEGGNAFYWPNLWLCNDNALSNRKLSAVIDEFVSYGVPRNYFVDFTFSGGETKWDAEGTPNWDGAILYQYIPANTIIGTDWLGQPIYGSYFDGIVYGGNRNGGYEDSVDSGYPEDYMLYVFSNDPRKNNVWWWN